MYEHSFFQLLSAKNSVYDSTMSPFPNQRVRPQQELFLHQELLWHGREVPR